MKSSDIATIIVIVIVTVLLSSWLANSILGNPSERVERVKYVETFSADLVQPSEENFNVTASNPTVEVYVGRCSGGQIWDEPTKTCIDPRKPGVEQTWGEKEENKNQDGDTNNTKGQ